jgi:hypothetical protein
VDYVTDVLGGIVAHYCFDHTNIGGLIFPVRNPGANIGCCIPIFYLVIAILTDGEVLLCMAPQHYSMATSNEEDERVLPTTLLI